MTFGRALHLLIHPVYTLRLIAYRLYEIRHPDEPWIAQGAVQFCEQHLDRSSDGLEFGSGRSTAWYAARLRRLTSVEDQKAWHEIVKKKLEQSGVTNVDYRFVALNHPRGQPTFRHYDETPDYVSVADGFPDDSLGLVVVDGHYRQTCILATLGKIRPGGFLLVDNTNWMPLIEWGVPPDWPVVHQSSNVRSETTIWRKPG